MVGIDDIQRCVGAVRDPHLPFGLAELGMIEQVGVTPAGEVDVVINMPCHHCPGLSMMEEDIRTELRGIGVTEAIRVSFQGRDDWRPEAIRPEARAALRAMGMQTVDLNGLRRGTAPGSDDHVDQGELA